MRKLITILGVCVLFITLSFSGCELLEEKENYITVHVGVLCNVVIVDSQGNWDPTKDSSNIPVRIEMIKDGGERFIFNKAVTNSQSGGVDYVEGSFKLYKEQRIEVSAEAVGEYGGFYEKEAGFAMLTWAEVDAAADFGGSYSWTPQVNVYMTYTNTTR
jgi:hypothetical protein